MMEHAWTREIEDIAREFNLDTHTGLTEPQIRLSLQKYGKNGKASSLLASLSDGSPPIAPSPFPSKKVLC